MSAETATTLTPSPVQWRARLRGIIPAITLVASRGGGIAVQFLVQVVVGALAGAAGLGVLQLFTSWSCLLGETQARGQPARAMRVVAVNYSEGNGDWIKTDLQRAAGRILRAAAGLAVLAAIAFVVGRDLLTNGGLADYGKIAMAVVIAAPLFALLRLGSEALKGANAPLAAITLENLVMPGIILLVCAVCWLTDQPVPTVILLAAGLAGFAATSLWLWIALDRRLNLLPGQGDAPRFLPPRDDCDLRALWANSVLGIAFLHLPFLVLPWYSGPAEIGVYAVAHKLVNIITMLLLLMASVFGPLFARAAAEGDREELRALLWRTQWLSSVVFFPMMLVLLLAGGPLSGLFSLPGDTLQPYLLVLAAGHCVNAATGLSGVLLNMAGGAGLELKTLLGSILFAVLLAPLIGPAHGALGLACLFSGSLAGKNLASYAAARYYLRKSTGDRS
jgi:O-antigen/teichoic acid export membrane protein